MEQASDEMYMTIKNDQPLLELFFAGLHRIARLTQGVKNPRSAIGKDVLLFGCAIPTPGYVALPGTNCLTRFSGSFLNNIYLAMAKAGYDSDDIEAARTSAEITEPLSTLVDEFWPAMQKYAQDNATYNSNWMDA